MNHRSLHNSTGLTRLAELERENERLKRRLQQAETVIEVQKKISKILQIPLTRLDRDENS